MCKQSKLGETQKIDERFSTFFSFLQIRVWLHLRNRPVVLLAKTCQQCLLSRTENFGTKFVASYRKMYIRRNLMKFYGISSFSFVFRHREDFLVGENVDFFNWNKSQKTPLLESTTSWTMFVCDNWKPKRSSSPQI